MKFVYMLVLFSILAAACKNEQGVDRDVFIFGDDFYEISVHADKQKSVPDMDMLLRVKLPPNPSRSEIINYINIIYTLSRNQKSYLDSDPQVGMLTKVGRDNVDLILQASKPGVQWTKYGIEAINILVDDKDRNLILENLESNYALSKVVFKKGWCKEAEHILSDMISASSGYLPSETIKCIASLKNPEHYPILISYMTRGWNAHTTYGVIKNLPGIELTNALQLAWEGSRGKNYQIGYLTKDTLSTGYLPAFHFLFETIDDNYRVPHTIYDAKSLIKQFTYQLGTKQDLKQWYEKNKDNIVFDKDSKKYVIAIAHK